MAKEIIGLLHTAEGNLADAHVQAGVRIASCYQRLERDAWRAWLRERLGMSERSAYNHMALDTWSREQPDEYAGWRHLGPSKLYIISAAPQRVRNRLRARPDHRVPSSGERKTLDVMRYKEVWEVLRAYGGDTPPPPGLAKLLSGLRRRINGLDDALDTFVGYADAVDADDAEQIYNDLMDAAERVAEAFGLE